MNQIAAHCFSGEGTLYGEHSILSLCFSIASDGPCFTLQFPDVIHAFKPNPKTNIQEYWRVMDFLSHFPESLHTFMFLFDDWGIPSDYRHMEGFGVHTYKVHLFCPHLGLYDNTAGSSHVRTIDEFMPLVL